MPIRSERTSELSLKKDLKALALTDKRQVLRALLESTAHTIRSFPLSFAQDQLWFMNKLQAAQPVYNIPLYIPFQGPVDVASITRALVTLARRHDMLRAHFELVDGEPKQVIEPDAVVDLEVEDLSALPPDQRGTALGDALNREVQRPFDLETGPCVRYRLFRLKSTNYLLSVTMHHIITDAWSLGVYVSEFRRTYDAYRAGQREAPLAPLLVDYCDYARWQRESLQGIRLSKFLKFWCNQLAGAPHVLHLPTDRPRPESQTFNGTLAGFVFSDELSAKLIELSRDRKVTLFMLLVACYFTLLYRYTGQEDILVGAPVANRGHPDLEPIIGIFVNTLILRARIKENLTFAELLADVRQMSLDAFEHQTLPFERLVDELKVDRVPGFPPLYQVVFNFQNAALIESEAPSAEGSMLAKGDFPLVHSQTAKVDLNLTVTQHESKISGGIEYNTDLFDEDTIETIIFHFRTIAEEVSINPSVPILEITLPARPGDGEHLQTAAMGPDADERSEVLDDGKFDFELR